MANDSSSYDYPVKTCEYSFRIPDPPRVIVPPPVLNEEALPQISLRAISAGGYLDMVNYKDIIKRNAAIDWSYELRRDAQMIIPCLFLGPLFSTRNEAFLVGGNAGNAARDQNGASITLILGVCPNSGFHRQLMDSALRRAAAMGIDTQVVSVDDDNDQIRSFPKTTHLINEHLARHYDKTGKLGAVLVVCETGNDRSAATVAAFLMATHEDMDHIKAIQLVQAQRFCVTFSETTKRVLQSYWDIICAQRQVATLRVIVNKEPDTILDIGILPRKRPVRSSDERWNECDETASDDKLRFENRAFAPFADKAN